MRVRNTITLLAVLLRPHENTPDQTRPSIFHAPCKPGAVNLKGYPGEWYLEDTKNPCQRAETVVIGRGG